VKDSAFSPDGQLIGNGDIYGIKLRRTVDGTLVLRIPNAEIVSISFSPDGSLIAGRNSSNRTRTPRTSSVAKPLPDTRDCLFAAARLFPKISEFSNRNVSYILTAIVNS
jgi:hypothetical protein